MKRFAFTRLAAGLPIIAAALLAGCATAPEPFYYWGDYQPALYGHFTKEKEPQEQIATLEAGIEKARATGKAVPPGYYAHLGLLYVEAEQTDEMLRYFEAEKALYPESTVYMDFLTHKFRKTQ